MTSTNTVSTVGMLATAGFFVVGLGAIFTSGSAAADPAPSASISPFSFPFSYERTELETREGATRLLVRLERAVRRECSPDARAAFMESMLVNKCIDATMQQAVGQIGSPTVAQAYETRVNG